MHMCALLALLLSGCHAAVILQARNPDDYGGAIAFNNQDTSGRYDFGYSEAHPSGATFRKETGDAYGNKYGSYGLRDADGRVRIVNYVADENGFRADVKSNEPGVATPLRPASASFEPLQAPPPPPQVVAVRELPPPPQIVAVRELPPPPPPQIVAVRELPPPPPRPAYIQYAGPFPGSYVVPPAAVKGYPYPSPYAAAPPAPYYGNVVQGKGYASGFRNYPGPPAALAAPQLPYYESKGFGGYQAYGLTL